MPRQDERSCRRPAVAETCFPRSGGDRRRRTRGSKKGRLWLNTASEIDEPWNPGPRETVWVQPCDDYLDPPKRDIERAVAESSSSTRSIVRRSSLPSRRRPLEWGCGLDGLCGLCGRRPAPISHPILRTFLPNYGRRRLPMPPWEDQLSS